MPNVCFFFSVARKPGKNSTSSAPILLNAVRYNEINNTSLRPALVDHDHVKTEEYETSAIY
jgi:hypothetical protein